jgi:hypothetical protein
LNGFVFKWKGNLIRGSALGRGYSGQGLQTKGVEYSAERDAASLGGVAAREEIRRPLLDNRDSVATPDRANEQDTGRGGRMARVRDARTGLNDEQKGTLVEIGRFRTVNVQDVIRFRYSGREAAFRQDLRTLKAVGWVDQRSIKHGKSGRQFDVLVLTVRGRNQAKRMQNGGSSESDQQRLYAGFVKANEVPHDAGIYRMYQAETDRIQKEGGTIRRVVLDYELKRKVFSKLNGQSAGSATDYSALKQQIAAENGLAVVNGRIQFPDLRIEFETREQEADRVDLELATGDYKDSEVQAKRAAGFKIYASGGPALYAPDSAPRSPALEDPEIVAGLISI